LPTKFDDAELLSIGAVERATGVSKDTLRMWERRYGFPDPVRDAKGERRYTKQQVERLRTIKRLVDQGFRPSKVIGTGANPERTPPDRKKSGSG
jgi:MerR family transcriptional regulator, light-induced transcriptional regulator